MAKTLTLIRHAAAVHEMQDDFHRALRNKGHEEILEMKAIAAKLDDSSALILCSSAARTRETLSALFDHKDKLHIEYKKEIYEASTQTLLELIAAQADTYTHIIMIGHNPGLNDLAYYLCHKFNNYIPTATILQLSLEIESWAHITADIAEVQLYAYPQ